MRPGVRRSVPNALTVARLALAAAFFATISLSLRMGPHPDRALWGNLAVVLFVVAAVTDLLDGYLARRWQVVSGFGRIMDPFVDKVLVLGAFVFLASPRFAVPTDGEEDRFLMLTGVHSWMVTVILSRELFVTSVRGVLEGRGIAFGAEWAGKLKMLLQSIAVPVSLFVGVNEFASESAAWRGFRDGLVWATLAVTVLSAWPYVRRTGVLWREA